MDYNCHTCSSSILSWLRQVPAQANYRCPMCGIPLDPFAVLQAKRVARYQQATLLGFGVFVGVLAFIGLAWIILATSRFNVVPVIFGWAIMVGVYLLYREGNRPNLLALKPKDKVLDEPAVTPESVPITIISCPECRQQLRIPTHKGELVVHCPKCSHSWRSIGASESRQTDESICSVEFNPPDFASVRCKACQLYFEISQTARQRACPECGADCSQEVHKASEAFTEGRSTFSPVVPVKERGNLELPGDLEPRVVDSENDIRPTNFTLAGWLLFLLSYAPTVGLILFLLGSAGEQQTQRTNRYVLLFIIFGPCVLGYLTFLLGKMLIEKGLNIRVIKKPLSEASLADGKMLDKVIYLAAVLVPIVVYIAYFS